MGRCYQAEKRRCAEVSRLYALNDFVSREPRADRFAHARRSPVASHQILALDPELLPGRKVARNCNYAVGVLVETFDARPVENRDARSVGGAFENHGLQVNLVDTMGWFRRRPAAVRAAERRIALRAARNGNTGQLPARSPGAEYDIVRVVIGQADAAHLGDEPQAPESFHRPRRHVVAFDTRRLGRRAHLCHDDIDSAPRQIDGETQPDRSAADDGNTGFSDFHELRSRPVALRRRLRNFGIIAIL